MKYISIDLETTGLDINTCQILQIGAVAEDTNNVIPISELPKFNCIVENPCITGEAFAINMNHRLIEIIANLQTTKKEKRVDYRKKHNILNISYVAVVFSDWCRSCGCETDEERVIINAAGKNFAAFDKVWLETLIPNWKSKVKIRSRILDPAILVADWSKDNALPGLSDCKTRSGLEEQVQHDGLSDAIDVIRIIRAATNQYGASIPPSDSFSYKPQLQTHCESSNQDSIPPKWAR